MIDGIFEALLVVLTVLINIFIIAQCASTERYQ